MTVSSTKMANSTTTTVVTFLKWLTTVIGMTFTIMSVADAFSTLPSTSTSSSWSPSRHFESKTMSTTTTTSLFAWTASTGNRGGRGGFAMPTLEFSLESPWYVEVNPTARKTVYDDGAPSDYKLLSIGSDWPSYSSSSSTLSSLASSSSTSSWSSTESNTSNNNINNNNNSNHNVNRRRHHHRRLGPFSPLRRAVKWIGFGRRPSNSL